MATGQAHSLSRSSLKLSAMIMPQPASRPISRCAPSKARKISVAPVQTTPFPRGNPIRPRTLGRRLEQNFMRQGTLPVTMMSVPGRFKPENTD